MAFCDLHCHSLASDGTDRPRDLPRLAAAAEPAPGLATLALTDHDTLDGLDAAAEAAAELGLRFLPGIELSVDPGPVTRSAEAAGRATLHLLGYGVDRSDAGLQALCRGLREARNQRTPAILERLAAQGVRVSEEDVRRAAHADGREDPVIGRAHIAAALVERGYVRSVHQAFRTYLGSGGSAFVRRDALPPEAAVEAVHQAGGLVALAHPVQLRLPPDELEHTVAVLADLGLDALEVVHPDHTAADVERLQRFADRLGLLPTGGSDYHGSAKSHRLNQQQVPDVWADALFDALPEPRRAGAAGVSGS